MIRSHWLGSWGVFSTVITVMQRCGSQSSSVSLSPSWCTSMTITSCTTDKRPTDIRRKRILFVYATLPLFWEVVAAHTARRLLTCFLLCKASFFNPCLSLEIVREDSPTLCCVWGHVRVRFERRFFGPLCIFLPVFWTQAWRCLLLSCCVKTPKILWGNECKLVPFH